MVDGSAAVHQNPRWYNTSTYRLLQRWASCRKTVAEVGVVRQGWVWMSAYDDGVCGQNHLVLLVHQQHRQYDVP